MAATVYLAWTSAEVDPSTPGPWRELVAPLHEIPKLARCRPGTTAWLRARFSGLET